MFWKNVAVNLWKWVIGIAGVAIAFYALIRFRLWSTEWTEYFIKVGKWEGIIFVSLVVAGVSIVLLKLLGWQVRAETRPRRRR